MKKMFKVAFCFLCAWSLLIALTSFQAAAQPGESAFWQEGGKLPYEGEKSKLVELFPNGLIIDWGEKIAISRGFAPVTGPKTILNMRRIEKEAMKNAVRKFAKVIGHTRISKKKTLKEFVNKNPQIKEKLGGLLKESAHVIDRRFLPQKKMFVVTVAFDLKMLWKAIKPHDVFEGEAQPAAKVAKKTPEETKEAPDNKNYTSLIIDTSGLGVKPSMSPVVYDEKGNAVYGMTQVDEKTILEKGLVSYTDSVQEAEKLANAGDTPLVVKAISLSNSPFDADVVVSEKDAARIMNAEEKTKILSHLNVIFAL